jgi:predicted lipoprotein with Yx(FWY)xxD motif
MRRSKRLKAGLALLVIGPVTGVFALGVFSPQATAASATSATKTKVVEEANRSPIGEMLVNLNGQSLYTNASGCTGSCLKVWPALLMPKGTTKPKGAKCLSTVPAAKAGRLQVTYDNQPLYTFVDDSGSSVNGNGVAGFEAAAVTPSCP